MGQNCCNNRTCCNRSRTCWSPTAVVQPALTPVTNAILQSNTSLTTGNQATDIPFNVVFINGPYTLNEAGTELTITGYSTYLVTYTVVAQNAASSGAADIVIDFLYNGSSLYPPGSITFTTALNPDDTNFYIGSTSNTFTVNTLNPNLSVPISLAIASSIDPVTVNANITIVGLT